MTFSESDRHTTPPSYNNDKDNTSIEESKREVNGGGAGGSLSEGSNGGGSCPDKGNSGDDGAARTKRENYTLRAFKSTPLFIESLTELSQRVLYQEGDKK